MTRRWIAGLAAAVGSMVWAHDPITTELTFHEHIAPILRERCAGCHRPNGTAFRLLTYDDARPWAKAIKHEVLTRRMPPGQAVKGFADLADDWALTQEELDRIAKWVEGGAPEGSPVPAPAAPSVAQTPVGRVIGTFRGSAACRVPVAAGAIRPVAATKGQDLEVEAIRADGSVVPLLWVRHFSPAHRRVFHFREPIHLAAGTEIRVSPPGAEVELLTTVLPPGL